MQEFMNRYDSDGSILPFEVVEVISGHELVIREMIASLKKGWLPTWIMGHCTNEQEQEWVIAPDPKAPTFRIRLRTTGKWKDSGGNVYRMEAIPVRFHRYSFVSGVYDSEN